jgi:hypothetical protein
MPVSVDNVYQKVLALANKEQRGYVTPQEFNLLADRAQSEIFEGYFHDLKTAVHKPGNQTEQSDEVDMLAERIAVHRSTVNLTAPVIDSNSYDFVSNLYTIPGTVHKLMSVYGGYAEEATLTVGELVLTAKTAGAAGNSITFEITEPAPGGVATTTVSGTAITVAIDPPPHTAADMVTAINASAAAKALVVPTFTGAGDTALTSVVGVRSLAGGFDATTEGEVTEVNQRDLHYILTNDYTAPSASRVIYVRRGANTIQPYPFLATGSGTAAALAYPYSADAIEKPATPAWGYVVVNEKPLYNANTTTDFDLHASEEEKLVTKILELAGIVINKPGLAQTAANMEQRAKVEENN